MSWKELAIKIIKKGIFKPESMREAVSRLGSYLKTFGTAHSIQKKPEAHHLFETGVSFYDKNNLLEAEKTFKKALKLYQNLQKKNPDYTFNVASTLHNLGSIFQQTGRIQKAEKTYYKALKMYESLAQKDSELYSPYVAETWFSLGQLYWKRRDFQKTESMYSKALKEYRTLTQKNSEHAPDLGDVLTNLGGLYYYRGDFNSAEKVYREALTVYKDLAKNTPEYLSDVAMTLNNLGVIYHNTGNFDSVEKTYKEVLNICRNLEKKNPDCTSYVAAALNNLGLFYWRTEELRKAEEMYTEALTVFRQLAQEDPEYTSDIAMTLGNLGLLYSTTREFDKAEEMYTEALTVYRQLAKEDPVYTFNVAGILSNLGSLHSATKKFHKAEKACREVLTLYRELSKKNPDAYNPYVAMALKNLGDTLGDCGKVEKAEKAYKEALTLYKTLADTHPAYNPYVAMVLNSMGSLSRNMGRLQKAEEALTAAFNQYKTLADTHPVYNSEVALTLKNLGALYLSTRQFSQAEKAFTGALAAERDLAKKNPQEYTARLASTLNMLGVLYADMGKAEKAEKAYKEALKIRHKLAQKNPDVYEPEVATILNNLGALYWETDNFKEAEEQFTESLAIKKRLAQKNPDIYESDLALAFNNLGNLYWKTKNVKKAEEMYCKALTIRERRKLWFELAESYSGLSLISHDKTEDALKLLELAILFSGEKKYMYAQKGKREPLYLNVLEYTDDPGKTFGILEALRDQDLLSLQWDLKETHLKDVNRKEVRTFLKKRVPPLDVPFQIPDNFLVLYTQYKEDHILYMVLTKEKTATFRGTPAFVKMGSRLLRNLLIQVYAQARGKAIEELIADFDKCSREWGSTLPSEIQEEISQKECIVFSPDSDCGLFPLEGLSLDGEPLCLSKMVTRTTSMHLLKGIPCRKPFGSSLIVGNPWPLCERGSLVYSSPSVRKRAGLTDIGPLTYLEGAETEVDTLAGVLPGVTVLKNLQATADTFLEELSHHSIIHLAGHGCFGRVLFFSGPATRISPEFEPEEFSTLRKAWRLSHGKTVYMMDEWDFVTDRDILTTQLSKGAFIFLNACETGKHIYAGGGHFQGLAQAFLKSGASNVISSLIPLFDQPSTDFAVSFYTALRSLSVVTALKNTRKRIRKKYRAQIYWLPYIHYGSPERV